MILFEASNILQGTKQGVASQWNVGMMEKWNIGLWNKVMWGQYATRTENAIKIGYYPFKTQHSSVPLFQKRGSNLDHNYHRYY